MQIPSKTLEQLAPNTRRKIEDHMLIAVEKSTQKEHFFQPLKD